MISEYYLKRLGQSVFTIWAVLTITFALIRWMPGGPLDFIRAQLIAGNLGAGSGGQIQGNPERMEKFQQLAERYVNINPNEPLHQQYIDYMTDLLMGDLGQSIWYQKPVMEVLAPAIPWTVFLGSMAIIISFVTRVVVGAVLAYKEGSNFDLGGTTALIWMHALPFFLVAILLVYIFGYGLGWFPTGGRYTPSAPPGLNYAFIAGIVEHAALPVISLAWAQFGAGALAMRANSIQVLGENYLRSARIRGIRAKRLSIWYVGRNAILPMYTQMLLQIGFIFGGSVILETVFQYPGVGFYMFRGIQSRDYPLLMGGFLFITISVVIAMLIADLTYGIIDPRVTRGESSEAF